MKSGLPIAASYTLILIYVRGDVLLLAYFHSPKEVGLYDIAAKIYEISTTLPHLFGGLIMPLMTRDYGLNWDRYVSRLGGALAAVIAVVVAVVILLAYYAEEIAVLLAGPTFKATAGPLRILGIAIAMAAPAYTLRFAAMAAGHQHRMLLVDIVGVACGLSAYWLLIPSWSYLGAAIGKCVVDMAILIGAASISSNLAAWKFSLRSTLEVLLAGAVMAGALWGLSKTNMPWYINAGCGIFVYLLTLAPMPKLRRGLRCLAAE
jgi:O-antigen/teichoic acid export membrane protein